MSDEQRIIDASTLGKFKLEITNWIEPVELWSRLTPSDVMRTEFDATLHVDFTDPALYQQIMGASAPLPFYTVEITEDRNPWRREVTGSRARLKRLRDGVWWTFRKRALRRKLIDRVKITVPNCRITALPPDPDE